MAMTHTLWFGNQFRDAVSAKTYLAFSNIRGSAEACCPPADGQARCRRRSHYQTIHLSIPDTPADDEIVIALGTGQSADIRTA